MLITTNKSNMRKEPPSLAFFLVMDMNFSLLLKTSHASPDDDDSTLHMALPQDLAHVLIHARAVIFEKLFINLRICSDI